jgi:hypothetical protein
MPSQGQSPAPQTTMDTSALLAELGEIAATMPPPLSGDQDHAAEAQHKWRPPPPPSPLRGSLGQVDVDEPGVSV